MTTDEADLLPLLGQDAQGNLRQINLIDYFPNAEGEEGGIGARGSIALNTFALDNGAAGDAVPRELGSSASLVPYTFTIAFFAASDALASAVLNDLRDRYVGRLARWPEIELWDYNSSSPNPVVRMDVESFSYRQNTDAVTAKEVHLYFAELILVDDVD